jgi:hypothetical protein
VVVVTIFSVTKIDKSDKKCILRSSVHRSFFSFIIPTQIINSVTIVAQIIGDAARRDLIVSWFEN